MNNKWTKPQLDDLLRVSDLRVVFTKVDGSERLMECTRNFENIPLLDQPTKFNEKLGDDNNVRVYDINAPGWRTFKADSVLNVEVI